MSQGAAPPVPPASPVPLDPELLVLEPRPPDEPELLPEPEPVVLPLEPEPEVLALEPELPDPEPA